jgi:toxin ParE1/3/4
MPQARILSSAVKDLDEIWLYIARDSIDAAERLIERIELTARKLARMPGIGPKRDEFAPGLRSFPLSNYVIFYRETDLGIDVLHVYHGMRDLQELFHPTDE